MAGLGDLAAGSAGGIAGAGAKAGGKLMERIPAKKTAKPGGRKMPSRGGGGRY